MNDAIARKELIIRMTEEAAKIQNFLEAPPTDDVSELADRLSYANVYMARTGKLLADAKALQDDAIVLTFEGRRKDFEKLGANLAAKVMQAYCKDEGFLVNWYERLNRELVHFADNLRTLISLAKENMRINAYADAPRYDGPAYSEEIEDEKNT